MHDLPRLGAVAFRGAGPRKLAATIQVSHGLPKINRGLNLITSDRRFTIGTVQKVAVICAPVTSETLAATVAKAQVTRQPQAVIAQPFCRARLVNFRFEWANGAIGRSISRGGVWSLQSTIQFLTALEGGTVSGLSYNRNVTAPTRPNREIQR